MLVEWAFVAWEVTKDGIRITSPFFARMTSGWKSCCRPTLTVMVAGGWDEVLVDVADVVLVENEVTVCARTEGTTVRVAAASSSSGLERKTMLARQQ